MKTDSLATPAERNVTWLAQAKELGYMLPAAANRLALRCCCFRMVAIFTTNSLEVSNHETTQQQNLLLYLLS